MNELMNQLLKAIGHYQNESDNEKKTYWLFYAREIISRLIECTPIVEDKNVPRAP